MPEESLSRGDMLGIYRLTVKHGAGGMAEVWRAQDTVLDREVAIKVISPALKASREFRVRFTREARAVARLGGKRHVIPIYHFDAVECYLVMLFVDGTDLATLLKGPDAATGLDPERAVRIVADVAEALTSAHGAGLVHRDVKPSNVLVSGDSDVWLVDFGIVSALGDEHLTRVTQARETPGTGAYMAPERFAAADVGSDARVDVYGLACVLYECLTGRRAFPQHLLGLPLAHSDPRRPCPSDVAAHLAPFDDVVVRGLAVAPGERIATAAEFADRARQALAQWNAAGLEPTERLGRPARRGSPVRDGVRAVTSSPLALGAATGTVGGVVALTSGLDAVGAVVVLAASYGSGFSWATWRRSRSAG